MSTNLELQLVIRAKDKASGDINKVMKAVQSGAKDSDRAVGNLTKTMQGYAVGTDIATKRSESLLGAIRRLANERGPVALISGMRSIADQANRAHRALESVVKAARAASGVAAGAAAAGYVISQPVRQTMAYDRELANLSNTAYAGQSMGERKAGMHTLNTAIVSAVRTGGGTRENALGTLDEMVASGAFSNVSEATQMLPFLIKSGTAANADPRDMARIAIRAKQTFGITDMPLALDQALRGGQLGGFELKDMAKWLPQQMAMATNVGMKGEKGFRSLIAANEAAVISAGTKDEAGNNVRDLLNEINTPHFATHMKKIGVDANGSLLTAQSHGVNKLEGTVALVEQIVARDKQYQALKAKLKTASKDEQKEIFEAMAAQVKGTTVGKIFHNQQSLMALLGIINNMDKFNEVKDGTASARGAVNDNHALIAETPSYRAEMLAAEKAIAMQNALDRVNPALGGLADGLTHLMQDWPVFSSSIVAASTALTALAAAAGAASLASMLTGGGGAAAGAAASAGGGFLSWLGITSAFAGGTSVSALSGLGPIGLGTIAGGVSFAGAAGYGVGTYGVNPVINGMDEHFGTNIGDTIGRAVAEALAAFGNKEAQRAIKIDIDVKNGNIVAAVNKEQSRQASRH